MKFGYVGVGLMGLPMTKHLLSKGHAVLAYDIVAEKTEAARAAGATAAASPAGACAGVDAVLLNLPTNEAVEEAVFGARGVASAAKPPQLVVDFSTKDTAYATLVSKTAVTGNGGMCMGRTLVKPNDCANSLLWQKLKYGTGSPELCGASMPFGAAMVSADVAQAVCDWINAGAMK